ncbi:MAG TPA: hydrogenase nickel incorporation protein HypB [Coriobacteriia bacterium]
MEIDLSRPILARNETLARENRLRLAEARIFALDVLASPGAGKTTTILATIAALRDRYRIAVIEGDVASKVDAEKVKEHGIPAVQINTGGACHLEADMISRALDALPLEKLDLVIVENVGNLVCPTEFDLGQGSRVVILSVPEGHDKPLKYPGIFAVADAILLNKYDTTPMFDFDEAEFRGSVGRLNGAAPIFPMSAKTGDGIPEWAEWLSARIESARSGGGGAPANHASAGTGKDA